MIKGDSSDYKLLEQWTKDFDCDGFASVEIGVREGMGSKIIMDNVINNYIHIGIDPYGNLEYQHYDDTGKYTCDYTDEMRDTMLNDFLPYRNQGKFTLYNDTDTKFMNDRAHQDSRFALVHFDGPHMTRDVITESIWFANRAAPKTRYIFDDYPKYNMQLIRDVLKYYDFDILDQGQNKICLEKNLMAYKDPNDPRKTNAHRLKVDHAYQNTERGYVISSIARRFKPSAKKYGGHNADESMDKKEFWRLYMNHIIIMKEKFPDSDGRLCRYCEKPFTFVTRLGTRGKGYQGRGPQNFNNFSIDRLDPRLTYQTNNIVFCCTGCNDRKKNSTPDDWRNFIRVEKELIND